MKPNTLSGMAAVLAHIPYQLGFYPQDSVVVIGLSGSLIVVTVRLDATDETSIDGMANTDRIDECEVQQVISVLRRTPVDQSIVIGYGGTVDPAPTVRQLADLLGAHQMPAHHEVVVGADSWRVLRCEFGCCRVDDELVHLEPGAVPLIAEEVFRGAAPLRSREEVVAQLDRVHPFLPAAVARSLGQAPRPSRSVKLPPATQFDALARVLVPSSTAVRQLDTATIVRACRALQHIGLRDCALAWLAAEDDGFQAPAAILRAFRSRVESLEWQNAADHPCERAAVTERLLDWVSCVPQSWKPPVLTLIAVQQWHANGGVLATAAAQKALDIDPAHSLAQLILRALHTGIRPTALRSVDTA